MARENLRNLHIYGEKTPFMERYIQFLAVAPKINGEYLLMTTQAAEANAFAKVYKEEHPEIMVCIDEVKRKQRPIQNYFHLLYREKDELHIKTIIKH